MLQLILELGQLLDDLLALGLLGVVALPKRSIGIVYRACLGIG